MHSEQPFSYRAWLIRLATWDAVLPAAIWAAPFLVRWALPNRRGAIEIASLLLPSLAFIVRYVIGRNYIRTNLCPPLVRSVQTGALIVGLIVLALIDCVLTLTHVMPAGAVVAAPSDVLMWVGLFSVYLAAMAVALYPGKAADSAQDSAHSAGESTD